MAQFINSKETIVHQALDGLVAASGGALARLDGCQGLLAAETDLNALDAKSGDGDTGSTLAGACRALLARINELPPENRTVTEATI